MLAKKAPLLAGVSCLLLALVLIFSLSSSARNHALPDLFNSQRVPGTNAGVSEWLHSPWQKPGSVDQDEEKLYDISLEVTPSGKHHDLTEPQLKPEPENIYESLRQYAVNNTVLMVPINSLMLSYGENMLCSLQKIGFDTKQLVFWTLDEEVGQILRNEGHNTFHDPTLFGVNSYDGVPYTSPEFKHMMLERPKFFIEFLSTGLDILFLDADIIFYGDPFLLVDHSVDLTIGSDSREFFGPTGTGKDAFQDERKRGDVVPPVCAGTFWMKSNKETTKLFQIMINVFEDDPSVKYLQDVGFSDDQRGLDVLLNDGRANMVDPLPDGITTEMMVDRYIDTAKLKVRMLDQALVASGHLYRNHHDEYLEFLARLESKGVQKLAIHLNWDVNSISKIDGAKEMGIWQLGDDGQCI